MVETKYIRHIDCSLIPCMIGLSYMESKVNDDLILAYAICYCFCRPVEESSTIQLREVLLERGGRIDNVTSDSSSWKLEADDNIEIKSDTNKAY